MPFTLYHASVPVFIRALTNLSAILRHNGVAIGKTDYLGDV